MKPREAFIALQLERLASFWPNLPATDVALDEWLDIFEPFNDEEVRQAVRHVIRSYKEQGAPKPGHLLDAVHYVRGDAAHTISPPPAENEPLCRECLTTRTLWDLDVEVSRNGPAHATTCSRYGEHLVPKPEMARLSDHARELLRGARTTDPDPLASPFADVAKSVAAGVEVAP